MTHDIYHRYLEGNKIKICYQKQIFILYSCTINRKGETFGQQINILILTLQHRITPMLFFYDMGNPHIFLKISVAFFALTVILCINIYTV